MSRIIAVWGCPDSGKTTFSIHLAGAVYRETKAKTICVFADSATPTLPLLFPHEKESRSIGAALSQTEITQETVLKSLVTLKKAKNIGFMGYTDGENRWTYPEFSEDKASALLEAAASLADVVLVDCGNKLTGALAFSAVCKADVLFRLCKPDLKAVSFFASQTPLYADPRYRMDEHQTVLNVTGQELYMPVEEAARHFKCGKTVLPYAPELKRQMMDGKLLEAVSDKAWNKAMRKIMFLAVGT